MGPERSHGDTMIKGTQLHSSAGCARRARSPPTALLMLAIATLTGAVPAAAAPPTSLQIVGATVELEFDPGDFRGGGAPLRAWVQRSGAIVAGYYGRFPVRQLSLRLDPLDGDGVHGGRTFANPAAHIRVGVGREVSAAQLENDWVLVHEMTHLALPDTGEAHAWLSEGIATYVEGIARVQAGNRSETDVWSEELHAMPRGLPQQGDAGLDHTHTWGRTYWGGAMFCLLADVEIRRRTQLRFGLQDALRAVLEASGGLAAEWPIERVLRTGDAAIGVPVLEELYARSKDTPVSPDLMALWRSLGVEPFGDSVRFDEQAPLAAVRRAIMQPRTQEASSATAR